MATGGPQIIGTRRWSRGGRSGTVRTKAAPPLRLALDRVVITFPDSFSQTGIRSIDPRFWPCACMSRCYASRVVVLGVMFTELILMCYYYSLRDTTVVAPSASASQQQRGKIGLFIVRNPPD